MKPTLLRILRHGLPAAAVLAGLGFVAAEVAGLFLASRGGANPAAGPLNDEAVATLRAKLPVAFAGWGFGLVAVFELLNWLVRGTPPAAPCPAPPPADNTPAPPPRLPPADAP